MCLGLFTEDAAPERSLGTLGGAGYTTPPTVTVPGVKGAAATVKLAFGKLFESNGSVVAITIAPGKEKQDF